MNKRVSILLFLISLSVLWMVGCGNRDEYGTKVEIFYINQGETKLIPETHYLKSAESKEMIVEVLKLLCEAPENKESKAILTGGINNINYSFEGTQVILSVGEKYKELTKTTEILTRASLVKSLTQIPGVEYVMITIKGEPIQDSYGREIGIMSAENFVDYAHEQFEEYEKVNLRLYFANGDGDKLIPINRELVHNISTSNTSMEKLVVEQILAGPANDDSFPTVVAGTKLLGVTVQDGVCYVNFDSTILTPANNVTSDITIYSIVNSLVELNNINKVQISVDGKTDIVFRDKYNLTTLFERNLDFVQ